MASTKDVEKMALDLMSEHGLIALGWKFKWDRAVQRLGQTVYVTKTISLSRPICEKSSVEKMRNTILHEIAHAHVGPGFGHGPRWVKMCLEIGGDGKRCTTLSPKEKPEPKYIGTCNKGHTFKRHRKTNKSMACVRCYRSGMSLLDCRVVWRAT